MALKTQEMKTDLKKYRENYDDIFSKLPEEVRVIKKPGRYSDMLHRIEQLENQIAKIYEGHQIINYGNGEGYKWSHR